VLSVQSSFNASDSLPNIALRAFLTSAVSQAANVFFGKTNIIKAYLRSAMIHTKLTNHIILSVERKLAPKNGI